MEEGDEERFLQYTEAKIPSRVSQSFLRRSGSGKSQGPRMKLRLQLAYARK